MKMRVLAQHSPTLYSLDFVEEEILTPTIQAMDPLTHQPVTYYRALTKDGFYVLYKRAIPGAENMPSTGGRT